MNIPWDQLQKNKVEIPAGRNSNYFLDSVKTVKSKYPDAKLVDATPGMYGIVSGEKQLCNPHAAHYDCWSEARLLIEAREL